MKLGRELSTLALGLVLGWSAYGFVYPQPVETWIMWTKTPHAEVWTLMRPYSNAMDCGSDQQQLNNHGPLVAQCLPKGQRP